MSWKRAIRPLLLATSAATLIATGLSVVPAANAATGDGSPSDSNIRYFGRWDKSSSSYYIANWAGAYFRTGFTGTTVKLKQRNAIDLWASIDGKPYVRYTNVKGTVNLTATKLSSGNHALVVSYRQVDPWYSGDAVFGGLVLDSGAKTIAPTTSPKLIEFVGDSITAGITTTNLALSDYAWLVGEQLGVEHTQIAQSGACLRELTAAQSTKGVACVGMQQRFVKISAADGASNWNFSRYTATAVVINLGTNDYYNGVTTANFQSSYISLLHTIRAKYPNAVIFAMDTLKQWYAAQAKASVAAVNNAGDKNVFYIDTAGWVTAADLTDGVHPNDAGHKKIAARLAPIIQAKI
jgi:lysophospholipase L1-like esterase